MSQAPSMPMFWGDFFGKTAGMTFEAEWAYCKLLARTWQRNAVPYPDNDSQIARALGLSVTRWKRLRPEVETFFDLSGGNWRNFRLEKEFQRVKEISAKRQDAGSRGGAAKALNGHKTTLVNASVLPQAELEQKATTHTQTQTQEDSGSSLRSDPAAPTNGAAKPDPLKAMFDSGVQLYTAAGISEKQARKLLAKQRQEFGIAAVISAIKAADAEMATEPISFVAACLSRSKAASKRNREGFGSPGFA